MNNELKVLDSSLIDMDRKAINSMVESYMVQVDNGEIDPLKAFVFSQKLMEFASQINAKLKEEIKGTKGEFNGLRISETKTGSKFDFSDCGSKKLDFMVEQMNILKGHIEAEQKFLKALSAPMGVYDPDTGETYEVKPPVNTHSMSVKVEWI